MKGKSLRNLTIEQLILIKILSGYFFTMSTYISKKMNIYIGFAIIMIISIMSWMAFMVNDWINYTTSDVITSVTTDFILGVLSLSTIFSFKLDGLAKFRFFITSAFLLYTLGDGIFYFVLDMLNSSYTSSQQIVMWEYITDAVMAFGGMFLFLLITDEIGKL